MGARKVFWNFNQEKTLMDWSKTKFDLKQRIVQEGEAYLSGQLKLATSADQRASMLAGAFAAAGTAIIAGLITLHAAEKITLTQKFPIYLGGGVTAASFLIAAGLCIRAIFPVGFWLPGNEPKSWYGDVTTGRTLDDAMGEEAEHIQTKIEDNRAVIKTNASRFKWGATLGIAAPVAGFIVWLISASSFWIFVRQTFSS